MSAGGAAQVAEREEARDLARALTLLGLIDDDARAVRIAALQRWALDVVGEGRRDDAVRLLRNEARDARAALELRRSLEGVATDTELATWRAHEAFCRAAAETFDKYEPTRDTFRGRRSPAGWREASARLAHRNAGGARGR